MNHSMRLAAASAMSLLLTFSSMTAAFSDSRQEYEGGVKGSALVIRGSKAAPKSTSPSTPSQEGHGVQISSTTPADPHEYYAYYGCPFEGRPRADDSCALNPSCEMPDGSEGIIHNIYRRLPGESWERTGVNRCARPGNVSPEDAAEAAAPIPEVTQEDFRKLPLQAASVHIQPGPDTLKNYHTNIYTEAGKQNLTAEMLGLEVQIRATPVSYIYDYGDGTAIGPIEDPGHALPADAWDIETNTSHQYRNTGNYTVRITTVFTGEYKVEDGPWQRIDGTAEVASDPQTLTVWRTESGWVDRPCDAGRTAWGC